MPNALTMAQAYRQYHESLRCACKKSPLAYRRCINMQMGTAMNSIVKLERITYIDLMLDVTEATEATENGARHANR